VSTWTAAAAAAGGGGGGWIEGEGLEQGPALADLYMWGKNSSGGGLWGVGGTVYRC
jgi:hypothetical protein